MARVIMDENFDRWEAYVSGGQPNGGRAAQLMFVCLSSPQRRPRKALHASQDPAHAAHDLQHMSEEQLMELFQSAEPLS